jgi:hypothetical protein
MNDFPNFKAQSAALRAKKIIMGKFTNVKICRICGLVEILLKCTKKNIIRAKICLRQNFASGEARIKARMTCGQRFAFGKTLLRASPESKPASQK